MNATRSVVTACLAGMYAWTVAGPCVAQSAPSPAPPSALSLAVTPTTMPAEAGRDVRHGTPYSMDHGPYDLNAPTSIEEEIYEVLEPHTAMFNVPFIDDPWNALIDAQRR